LKLEAVLKPARHFALAVSVALALAAFAHSALLAGASGLWLDVPYVHQEKDGCGSASLSMLLQYWQAKSFPVAPNRFDPLLIQRELYAAKPHGIYASDMLRYLRDSGMDAFAFRGDWSDLRAQLAKGRPLIAGLKPRGAPAHYVVVVGLDPDDSAVLLNDPERGKLVRSDRAEFEKAWQGTSNWTLLAVPRHS
jgi:predicted double-glycine peptidase